MEEIFLKKFNNYHSFGMIFIAIYLFSIHNDLLPGILEGLCSGLGITLTFVGMYAYNHDISNLRKHKVNFLKKCFGKAV